MITIDILGYGPFEERYYKTTEKLQTTFGDGLGVVEVWGANWGPKMYAYMGETGLRGDRLEGNRFGVAF